MRPKLIDEHVYQKINQQIKETLVERDNKSAYNYFNIFGIFFIVLIPVILYYRYSTKKNRKENLFKIIYGLNKFFNSS